MPKNLINQQKMILVIGLGNPILGDDGVGWRVVELVETTIGDHPRVEIDFLSLGGLSLMERMIGYTHVIIVDAIITGDHNLGSVLSLQLDELPISAISHLSSAHDTTIQDALNVGKFMGAKLPENIYIIAIEAQNVYDFSDELSPRIGAAVPKAAQKVMEILSEIESKLS